MQVSFFGGIRVLLIVQAKKCWTPRLAIYAGKMFFFEIPVWPIMQVKIFFEISTWPIMQIICFVGIRVWFIVQVKLFLGLPVWPIMHVKFIFIF